MNNERDQNLHTIRPVLQLPERNGDETEMQVFQDTVLRPILKFQNAFLLRLAGKILLSRHPDWNELADFKKVELIASWSSKDLEIKKQMEGAILGMMTDSELDFYFQNEREIQRRIRAFVLERIRTGLVAK
jgi:hypothetical protein